LVVRFTFKVVAVAAVTVPTAPLLNVTVLFAALISNPKPLIVMLEALAAKFAELLVITGVTVATWTAAPLLVTPFVVTRAVNTPAVRGGVEKLTVSDVADEAVTVPTANPLKSTRLFPGVELKPNPLMVIDVAFAARPVVLLVITGTTVATWTGETLGTLFVVTVTDRAPAAVGGVVMLTVSCVSVAAVTVPAAPLVKVRILLPAVSSKPSPLIVMVDAFAARFAKLAVTLGTTVAT
jgi:hypothetical protein